MEHLREKALLAKNAALAVGTLGTLQKDKALQAMADALISGQDAILAANARDLERAKAKGTPQSILDRLLLDPGRIKGMADGLLTLIALPDPVGEVVSMWTRPNGLRVGQKRVPIGVIGIIYEARPNVTADAIGLCIKSGNAVVLRGGSDAIDSNVAIVRVMAEAGEKAGLPAGAIQLIEDTSRDAATELMRLNGVIDVLIPRGGAGLIQSVVKNATVPVIETGVGNCHVYVDALADLEMAKNIVINAKTSRPGVCNAIESLLVARDVARDFLPGCLQALKQKGVEVRGCAETRAIVPWVNPATEEDYATEFLDYIISVKVVDGLDEAIAHINRYGTKHSECIVTNGYAQAEAFLQNVDAAAVYVNASTRFTDGGEFGFGAELGISTQKLHARGPMGLKELTTIKYIVYGNGQIR